MKSSSQSKNLRRDSTDAEQVLWDALRNRQMKGYKFRRQHPLGKFIVDFACIAHRLVIEADGGQHADNPDDAIRTAWLETNGWRVIRFWNNDILANPDGVLDEIMRLLQPNPHPPIHK
jgi:primosomal protein N' (replication factor Y)